jgi:hypothetical protein
LLVLWLVNAQSAARLAQEQCFTLVSLANCSVNKQAKLRGQFQTIQARLTALPVNCGLNLQLIVMAGVKYCILQACMQREDAGTFLLCVI